MQQSTPSFREICQEHSILWGGAMAIVRGGALAVQEYTKGATKSTEPNLVMDRFEFVLESLARDHRHITADLLKKWLSDVRRYTFRAGPT